MGEACVCAGRVDAFFASSAIMKQHRPSRGGCGLSPSAGMPSLGPGHAVPSLNLSSSLSSHFLSLRRQRWTCRCRCVPVMLALSFGTAAARWVRVNALWFLRTQPRQCHHQCRWALPDEIPRPGQGEIGHSRLFPGKRIACVADGDRLALIFLNSSGLKLRQSEKSPKYDRGGSRVALASFQRAPISPARRPAWRQASCKRGDFQAAAA
jgi:hypothetical protein